MGINVLIEQNNLENKQERRRVRLFYSYNKAMQKEKVAEPPLRS